ncbi:MAG TPA: hypothetical protein VEZ20_10025 [Allosphingosinicella sp.]|jgi:hypothetical protein|nr:hypothetical protein [Allosphingosinicella sp.]
MRQVGRLTPADRLDWARAMAAEASCVPLGAASLHFALGCFWSTVRLRVESRYRELPDEVALGLLIGALFCVHAAFPGTHAWPLMWPAVGGAVAVLMSPTKWKGCSGFSRAGAKTGAASATVFFLGGVGFLSWVGAPDLGSRIGALGIGAALAVLISAFTASVAAVCIGRSSR